MPGPPSPPPSTVGSGSSSELVQQIEQLEINGQQQRNGITSKNVLTGKQEHYLKRELISRQVKQEIGELNSPTALERFGAPFKSPLGEVEPIDSELPILRYIFVNHLRNFPFLDQAKEKEFWQDRVQVFLESFAKKSISSSEDRLEETKRRKIALKCEKIVELMMNSGIPTASGYEERVSFNEIEAAGGADRNAQESALLANVPEGHWINGWDVNVACVRQVSIRRTVRYHMHAEFILRVKREGMDDVVVGRRYGAFVKLHRDLRNELPGKVLPPVPRKIKTSQTAYSSVILSTSADDDAASISSVESSVSASTAKSTPQAPTPTNSHKKTLSLGSSLGSAFGFGSSRNASGLSFSSDRQRDPQPIKLWRENQRVSLRAFMRSLLEDNQVANSEAMSMFLLSEPVKLNEEELEDEARRRAMDEVRLEEQKKFYELARERARELDVYMEGFRKDIVEANGLTKLFSEIRQKNKLADLDIQYRKFAEWLRIEVAAAIYHIFLAEDNAAELFAQGKRIHSLMPYGVIKNVIRFTNPAAVMSTVLNLFTAAPMGTKSLMQRVFTVAINDGIRHIQKSVDVLITRIGDKAICERLKLFTSASEDVKNELRKDATETGQDLVLVILRSNNPQLGEKILQETINKTEDNYLDYKSALNNIHDEVKKSAQLFAYLQQLLKLYTRIRDKQMMKELIDQPVTIMLFCDLFRIFYEPLVRVYKSANVYNSVTDFAVFIDDMIGVIEKAQSQDMSTDPNMTVQSFIDLCARHENNFYSFVHEVHINDDGLFDKLMGWLEGILEFLRKGPASKKKLDMCALFTDAVEKGIIDEKKAKGEIDQLIDWQTRRRKWHQDKTRQKMAGDGKDRGSWGSFSAADFGVDETDMVSLAAADESDDEGIEEDDNTGDPIETERKRRQKYSEHLKAKAGEPVKPVIVEIAKLGPDFLGALREVLAE
ncbi:Similar to PX domain-containing protein C1450.12; acc. no. Q9Y7N9 [Pyronema omphalodes CBS 100304]|uniref:Similar to PX domain-containing protein C1450.12 acc. no. Q9Y7N9 n=1 Tax=Pyronema omphalodes (strain CBS 100304) TaxID=1076935 RepID=U4LI09_PYROM|nr:Similar to PX domain-containing protein C1450.12; acc. no. Q9Y7N9 [Pyronema omphalodes CBS 100304]